MRMLCGTILAAAVAVTCAMRAESVAGGICVADGGPKWRMFDRRVGMFVHWGVYSVGGVHEQEWMRTGMTKEEYEKYPLRFTGEKFDPDAWIDAAESFGAEYIVFTAKHHDGFCMWDTALTDWKSTNTPFGRDAVGELAAACRRRGMHLGLYYSNPDWHHPNAYNPLSTHQLSAPNPGDSPDIAKYREYVKAQVTELLTRYGDICCLFWDIPPHVEDASMNELVRRLQPGIMVNNRGWSADGDYSTPERGHGDQGSSPARFCEVCDSLDADSWGYNRNARWHTPEYLRTARDNALSKGWNFLLNVGPKPDGTIPDEALAILKKLGKPAGCVLEHAATDVADPAATAARIVMDTNMNQFDPNPSRFESPAFQKECGFNAVALRMNGLPLAVTALYDGYDSRVFPEGSDARKWVLAVREQFAAKIREAKAAGLAVFVNTDVIVLPRRMKELYKDEICRPDGRIDFMKPKTLEIHRALIGEFFDTFPELDGIVVRTGETYTFKTPFHGGNGPCDYKNDLEGSKAAHAALMNLLREEVCVKRGKTCIYRTWDFGYFHARPDYYRDVAGRVRPHEKFIISIKHCAADFFRGIDFNRTLGLGEHPQIVEVQCQREYEGKGAFPSYIADSVINGFEENEGSPDPHTLRDFAKSPLFAGVWTWSRGGGWVGPCIKNEFWCELNARVMANWANGEQETEEGCFRKAAEAMGVMPESVDALHRLALLTPKAILRGKLASDAAAAKGLPVGWVRDCYLAGINIIIGADWLYNRILDGSIEGILADRREAVGMWEEIVELAKSVRCRDKADESYILTSSIYGLRLFRMIEAGWDVMATGLKGDMFGHVYDTARLKAAIERYDRAKAEYMNLPKERPDAATLFTDQYVRIKVREAFHEVTPVPGLGETVDRYRMHLKEE